MLRAARRWARGRGSRSWSRGGAGSCSLILPGTIDLMLEVVEQPDQVLDLPIPFLGRAPEEVDHFPIGQCSGSGSRTRIMSRHAHAKVAPSSSPIREAARISRAPDLATNSIPRSLAGTARPRLGVNEVEHRKASLLVASRGAVPLSDERLAGCEVGKGAASAECIELYRSASLSLFLAGHRRGTLSHADPGGSAERRFRFWNSLSRVPAEGRSRSAALVPVAGVRASFQRCSMWLACLG